MKLNLICLCFSVVIPPLYAQWQLIDNFEQWEVDHIFSDADDIGWNATSITGASKFVIWSPRGESGDLSLEVLPLFVPSEGVDAGSTFTVKEFPDEGIAPGESAVLFFRALWTLPQYSGWHIGTTDKNLEYDNLTGKLVSPDEYADFNVQIRLSKDEQGRSLLSHRDGDHFVSTNPAIIIGYNRWYRFWIHVKNSWDTSVSPPISTGAYRLYMQAPDDGRPLLIEVGTDPPKEWASFSRIPTSNNGEAQVIKFVMFATSQAPLFAGLIDSALDDLYFIKINGWNAYRWLNNPTESNSDIDTGDLLGWLNINSSPYIWSYSLMSWLYIEEPAVEGNGTWAYFYK